MSLKSIFIPLALLGFLSFYEPTVPIVDYNGLKPYLNKQNDTTYVVNFWATWCRPCVLELPYFEQVNQYYKDKKVKVILVSLDFPKKYETQLLPFIKKNEIQSQVILLDDPNSNEWINKIDSTWSGAIPATLIYNKTSRNFYEQSFTYEELDSVLNSKLPVSELK